MSKTEKIFPLNTLGGRIQHLRKESLKMSRPEFYDLIYPNEDVAVESKSRTVKNWESGQNEPSIENLKKICSVLKCSVDYLLDLDECTNKSIQFIHGYTGLSETSIKRLNEFTTYHQGKIRLTIIDYFISDIRFSHSLTDKINDYFENYCRYEKSKKIFTQENIAERQLDFCDWVAYIPSISRQQLKGYENSKDIKHFNVQKEFDTILEDFVKLLCDKYSEKSPSTN